MLWLVNTRVWIRVTKHGNFPPKVFLNNYCGYFVKELPNGFPCLDDVIQTLGMLLDFRKAKNTHVAARVFLRFSTVSQHPACLDHVIQTQKTTRYFFNPSIYVGNNNRCNVNKIKLIIDFYFVTNLKSNKHSRHAHRNII